jgi:hypothetical protein
MTLGALPRGAQLPLLLVALVSCARGAERAAPAPPAGSAAPPPAAPSATPERWRALAARLRGASLADRFVEASALFLGVPYHDGPLGEGDAGGPDPDPRVDLDRADCVTYLEQSLALALCGDAAADAPVDPFLAALDRIRYRDGVVGFASRNHYMSLDWIPANAWLLEDVTERVAPAAAVDATRRIDRAAFLRERGVEPRPGLDDPRDVTRRIVPREAVAAAAPAIASGDLVFWAGRKDGILVVHTGLAVRDASGALLFRHASSKAGKVAEEPLADYAARATFSAGFLVLRLRTQPVR